MKKRTNTKQRQASGVLPADWKDRPLREVWDKLTDAQRSEYVKQYERGIDPSECEPPSREEAALHARVMARVRRRRGRPKIGKGAKDVLISVERGFLQQVDAYAKANGMSRSELFARGAMAVMSKRRSA